MTGKLIKYELRSSMKLMTVVWAALIVCSILFSISTNVLANLLRNGSYAMRVLLGMLQGITGLLYGAVFAAMIAVAVIIIILRFYRGLLGDEGYLMHTLPVKPWQLITSKGVSAVVIICVSAAAAVVSILILIGTDGFDMIAYFASSTKKLFEMEPAVILIIAEFIIIGVLSVMKSIYQIYASLAIGQLAGKHRILLSLGAYVGISILVTVMAVLLMTALNASGVLDGYTLESFGDVLDSGQKCAAALGGITILQLVVFHVTAERILSLRLNLQ